MNNEIVKYILENNLDLENMDHELLIQVLEQLEEETKVKARNDFYTFVRICLPAVLENPFVDGRHLHVMCKKLEKLGKREINRLMIFMPPRSGKSKIASVLFPAWCLGRNPHWQVLQIGHRQKFAEDNFSRPVRELLKTEEYQSVFPDTEIQHDMKSKQRWETTKKGKYVAAGAGTSIAGIGADIVIIDDVLSEQTAYSELERTNINEWYHDGLRTRLQPDGLELVINTRWHLDDISGHLLEIQDKYDPDDPMAQDFDPWEVLSLPALVDEEASKVLGHPVGSSFWPELWPTKRLMALKAEISPNKWAALYMQNPVPDEGSIIKSEYLQEWPHADNPDLFYVMMSIDTAFSTGQYADFSAYTVWGVFWKAQTLTDGREARIPNVLLLEAKRGRWAFPELCEEVQDAFDFFHPDNVIVEKKASGISLIQELRRRGIPVIEFNPEKDKETRMHACTPTFQAKSVWHLDFPGISEYKLEMLSFPFGKHDDWCDTTSQAIIFMREAWKVQIESDWEEDEEDKPAYLQRRGTYWSGTTKRLH